MAESSAPPHIQPTKACIGACWSVRWSTGDPAVTWADGERPQGRLSPLMCSHGLVTTTEPVAKDRKRLFNGQIERPAAHSASEGPHRPLLGGSLVHWRSCRHMGRR